MKIIQSLILVMLFAVTTAYSGQEDQTEEPTVEHVEDEPKKNGLADILGDVLGEAVKKEGDKALGLYKGEIGEFSVDNASPDVLSITVEYSKVKVPENVFIKVSAINASSAGQKQFEYGEENIDGHDGEVTLSIDWNNPNEKEEIKTKKLKFELYRIKDNGDKLFIQTKKVKYCRRWSQYELENYTCGDTLASQESDVEDVTSEESDVEVVTYEKSDVVVVTGCLESNKPIFINKRASRGWKWRMGRAYCRNNKWTIIPGKYVRLQNPRPVTRILVGNYTIQQKSSQRYLDAHEDSKKDYSVVTRPKQNNKTQVWVFEHLGNNIYTIKQKSKNRYMDAWDKSKNFNVVTRTKQKNNTQKWIIKRAREQDTYTIQHKVDKKYLNTHEHQAEDFSVVTRANQKNKTQKWIIKR